MDEDKCKKARSSAKGMFTKARNNLLKVIRNNSDIEIVENRYIELKKNYSKTLEKHEEYLRTLDETDGNVILREEEWIKIIDEEFDDAEIQKINYIRKGNIEAEDESKKHASRAYKQKQQRTNCGLSERQKKLSSTVYIEIFVK